MSRLDAMIGRDYQDRDGNTKTAWTKIGAAFPTKQGGYRLSLDALPTPRMGQNGQIETTIVLMPPRDGQQSQSQPTRQQPAPAFEPGTDDSIPF